MPKPAAPLTFQERRRLFATVLPASLLALGLYLWESHSRGVYYWALPALAAGFAFSYFLPARLRLNCTYAILVAVFILAGIRITALREELESSVLLTEYGQLAVLLFVLSSFKVFRRLDLYFMLGAGALLTAVACAMRPGWPGLAAALLFVLLAGFALWPRRPSKGRSAPLRV